MKRHKHKWGIIDVDCEKGYVYFNGFYAQLYGCKKCKKIKFEMGRK